MNMVLTVSPFEFYGDPETYQIIVNSNAGMLLDQPIESAVINLNEA